MFESAEASGRLEPDEFTTEDVLRLFGIQGFDIIFFDALIGNGDRHAGNFGYLRNANTGEYVGMAPLFDFDHAFESNNTIVPILCSKPAEE
jgi:serine/threonine protein kinase HipA of HipAB toxin-antitoxin module